MKRTTVIFADNAATTKLDPVALDAMMPFLRDEFGNPSSPYSFSRSVKKAIADARVQIAECIGAVPDEIFFTSGGSESNNWAIKGLAEARSEIGRHIITSAIDHHAVLNSCRHLEMNGWEVTYLIPDKKGHILPSMLAAAIRSDTICISVMLANNEIGTIEDIQALASLAKRCDVSFHTDAVQAVGHIPVDVRELSVDMLSASAHKFNGPKGIGFLFVRKGTPLVNFIDGGRQEFEQRAGTENVAGVVGMAVALKNNCDRMTQNTEKLQHLTDVFRQRIQNKIPSAVFNGDEKSRLPGHISFSIPGISGEALLHILDLKGIAISTGAACNSNFTEISHVLKAINLPESQAKGTIRISLGYNNTENDPIDIVDAIVAYMERVKQAGSL
jgi:cysteine desulfurase